MLPRLLIGVIVVLIVAAVLWFAWLGPQFARGRREQAAVRAIRGFVDADTEWNGRVVGLHLEKIGDSELQQLIEADLSQLRDLKIADSQLGDVSFASFEKLKSVRKLDLQRTPVSETALKHLATLTDLEWLILTDTGVKFKDVDALQKSLKSTRIDY